VLVDWLFIQTDIQFHQYYNERDYAKCSSLYFSYNLNYFYERWERFFFFFFFLKKGPFYSKLTLAGPSGEELTMHIKDGYINRIINVIAVPIMNRDGSVDKVTLGNG